MVADLRDEVLRAVRDVQGQIRVLGDFGVRMVARRTWRPEPVARPVAPEPTPEPAAQPSSGRAQAHLFAPPRQPARDAGRITWKPNPLPSEEVQAELDALRRQIGDCTRCPLHGGRRQVVFGEGDPKARLAVVGEGPGMEEDRTGRPFVGPAGQLLDRILAAMGLERRQVFICNVVKCRPPQNRTPTDSEMRTCGQFLEKQLGIVRPRHVLCLGATAASYLLNTDQPMGRLRGRFFDHLATGARIMPTYHPAYLLRNESAKKLVWQDVQLVITEMARPEEEAGE